MRLGKIVRTCSASAVFALATAIAVPAYAHPEPGADMPPAHDMRPDWHKHEGYRQPAVDPQAREAWLAECRSRVSRRDNGVGGAVIGGLIGGVAGNRIAGKGHRTVGTIAGAAVGAAAGMAIDKAEDEGRTRDECETYLDDYYARASYGQAYGYGYPAYGYTYAMVGGCCQPPMMMQRHAEPECTETVEYEYVDVPARPKVRYIPEKRIKVVPDKRLKQ